MIGSILSTMVSRTRMVLAVAFAAVLAAACSAPAASAGNLLYWNNVTADQIQSANLDGSGGGKAQDVSPDTIGTPEGIAIDPAAGKIYWADYGNSKIEFANLSGGGGGTLNTTGATISGPFGIGIDPQAGKIYWASSHSNTIGWAHLNGTGGGNLATGSASVQNPIGVAVDPSAGTIYWANWNNNTVSFAFLNGGGGGDLFTSGSNVANPEGVAVDPVTNQIFWANQSFSNTALQRISFASLSGVGGGNLNTGTASVSAPSGVAIDTTGGKIYWGNQGGGQISFALVSNGGGGQFNTSPTTSGNSTFPALLKVPTGTGVPAVTGGTLAPAALSCSQGGWAGDVPQAQLYQAPQAFSYSWTMNGSPIVGATSSSFTATSQGTYSCEVTAKNFAGSTSQTSAGFQVAPSSSTNVSVTGSATGATASLTLTCHGIAGQKCSGPIAITAHEKKKGKKIIGVSAKKRKSKPKPVIKQVTVASGSFSVTAGQTVKVNVTLNHTGKQVLAQFKTLRATLSLPGTSVSPRTLTFRYPEIRVNTSLLVWRVVSQTVGGYTTANSLIITPIPSGSTVQIACSGGGCPFSRHTARPHRSQLSVTKLFGKRHLQPSARVKFTVTAPNHIGEVLTYALRALPMEPKAAIRCLAPGSKRAVKC